MNERGHLSSETLDLLSLAALAGNEAEAAQSHLGTCDSCKRRWDELNEDKQRFEQFVFPRTLASVEARAKKGAFLADLVSKWKIWTPALGVGMAAVVAVVVVPRMTHDSYVGLKGGSTISVVARRGESQFEVKPGAHLKAKDQLRFIVEAAGARYLLIASRDGSGNLNVYYPFGGAQSAPLEAGKQELPGSVELDEVAGPERLFVLFSDAPLRADDVKSQLATHGDRLDFVSGLKEGMTREFVKDAP